jgi:hypothetical protein
MERQATARAHPNEWTAFSAGVNFAVRQHRHVIPPSRQFKHFFSSLFAAVFPAAAECHQSARWLRSGVRSVSAAQKAGVVNNFL